MLPVPITFIILQTKHICTLTLLRYRNGAIIDAAADWWGEAINGGVRICQIVSEQELLFQYHKSLDSNDF
jgi:hypothetical protein